VAARQERRANAMRETFSILVMKYSILILSLLVLTACSHPEIPFDDLVEKNGVPHQVDSGKPFTGIAVTFHENGQIKSKTTYKDGKREGLIEWFWENGQLGQTGNLKNGKKEGLFEMFDHNGRLVFTSNYKNGVKQRK
jgi:hypothetical protein